MVAVLIHLQVLIHRQLEKQLPDSVQLLLHGGCGAVCVFLQQSSCGGDHLPHPSVDLVQDFVVQIHDVHHALPNGAVLPAKENTAAVEECGELVVCVCVRDELRNLSVFHGRTSAVTDTVLAFTGPGPDLLKPETDAVTIVSERDRKINQETRNSDGL